MNKLKKFVALALVLCMILTVMPVYANAASEDFLRVYHLDCGRKFFETADVEELVDLLSETGYTHLELALGNDGLRLILDDMSVLDYESADVAAGIKAGNKAYSHSGEWTQEQMDAIIDYANERSIEIIPLINTPGHMDAILDAMERLGIDGAYNGSDRTVDVTNAEAVEFTQALVAKYVDYFASRGCTYFNMGADEYANDVYTEGSMGFGHLQSYGLYDEYADYVNGVAAIIKDAGMTPIAFNDGFYFNNKTTASFDSDIVIAYWTSGWGSYKVASAATLANKGHKILNTNDGWYYVLGRATGTYGYSGASSAVANTPVTDVPGSNDPAVIGAMACLWCDTPSVSYASNEAKVHALISTLAESNPDYFVPVSSGEEPEVTEPEATEPETPAPVVVTDDATGVGVCAIGLTGLTAAETAAPAIEGAAAVVAYDMELMTAEGVYTGSAEVSIPVPAGWTNVRGGVLASENGGEVLDITGKVEGGLFTFTAPHFSTVVAYEAAAVAAELDKERTVRVTVGYSATDFIEGVDYSGNYSNGYATVNAVYESVPGGTEAEKVTSISSGTAYYIQNANGQYLTSSAGWTSSVSSAAKWTAASYNSGYRLTNGSNYLRYSNGSLSTTTRSNNATTWGFSSGSFTSGSYTLGAPVELVEREPAVGTTVTFTGELAGTTVITIGDVTYTVIIEDERLTGVSSLTVEYWITNNRVTAGGSTSRTIAASAAYGKNGVELTTLIPATGTMGSTNVAFWKGTRLDSSNQQTTGSGVNKTLSGTDFAYIRYYGGNWAYSADGVSWTNVVSGDQIVAYFLQITEVTEEVTTQVVDWGELYGNSYNDDNYVLVDYAVKYESGERTPNAFPINGTTLKFHCSSDSTNVGYGNVVYDSNARVYYRNLWSIRAVETSEYEVYMITLTPTSNSATEYLSKGADSEATGQRDFYAGTEKVVWVDDEANLGSFADESLHYTSISGDVTLTVGGEPVVEELEIYNRHGMLVTYYVRAKATEDALTVHYIDATEGADNLEFYTYNIAVKEGTTFKQGIALPNPWKGNLVNGDVVNYYGRTQNVSSDLSTLSQIGAQYLYTDYECIRVERVDDKNVNLYYTFNPTAYFVADFGLPMEITAADLSSALKSANITDMEFSGTSYTTYGQLTDNGSTVTYKPRKVLDGLDYFTLLVKTSAAGEVVEGAQGQVAFRVYIVPGTTVYYEEGFASAISGTWTGGATGTAKQETHLAGSCDMNYGYTAAYNAAGATNGTEAVSTAAGNKAEIVFNGTGIEVYANSDSSTGTVAVLVYGKDDAGNDKLEKLYQVDTAAVAGKSAATDNQGAASYSLPIVSIDGLAYGSHRVVLQHTGAGHDLGNIRLDGFRVHNPLGSLSARAYDADEQNPAFVELRNAVLTGLNVTPASVDSIYEQAGSILSQVYENEGSTATMALVLGEGKSLDVQDLLDNGPKNELFLWPNETVTFNLGSAKAQIGLKAPMGETGYEISGVASGTIKTAADMFYGNEKLTGTIVIKNTGSRVLSVTKLKLFGAEALQPLTVEDVAYTLSVLGYTDANGEMARPGAPVMNPFVDVAEDSWYYDSVMWAVEKDITTGADAAHFLPDAICQRASVVTFLWRAAGCPEPENAVNPFVDVTEDTFFYKAVLWAVENGITNGVDANHFAPFGSCSRAQVVTFLWRSKGCPAASAVNPFTDVAEGSWYYDSVVWAVENGITNGMGGSVFGVDGICNRAQIVTFLYRASVK